jgi:hypothetical protein
MRPPVEINSLQFNFSIFLLCRWLGFRLLLLRRTIDELEVGHRGGVTLPRTEFHDAAITALATASARRKFREQLSNRLLLAQEGKRYSTGVQIAAFAQCDHPFGERPNCLRLRQCCSDAAMLNEAANLVCQQQVPMLGLPAQFDSLLTVTHKFLQRYQLPLVASFPAHRRLNQPRFKLHSET